MELWRAWMIDAVLGVVRVDFAAAFVNTLLRHDMR